MMQYPILAPHFATREFSTATLRQLSCDRDLPFVFLSLLTVIGYRRTFNQRLAFTLYYQTEQDSAKDRVTGYAIDYETQNLTTLEDLVVALRAAVQGQRGEELAIDRLSSADSNIAENSAFTVLLTAAPYGEGVESTLYSLHQVTESSLSCVVAGMNQDPTVHLIQEADYFYAPLETYLDTLIQAILDRPQHNLHHYNIVGPAEVAQQDQWGQGQLVSLVFDRDQSRLMPPVYRTIEELAAQFPDHLAARSGELADPQCYTYGQLNQNANRLARLLQALAVQPGDRVVTFLSRSIEILRSILAIHKAGAVYIPIDPSFPTERIRVILEEIQPKLILTQTDVQADLNAFEIPTINVSAYEGILQSFPSDNLDLTPSLDSPSHIFFTSGTTGKPKGVVATHRNLVQYLSSARDRYGFNASDRFIAAARYTFSISLFELLLPLYVGASVRIVSRSTVLDLKLLAQELEDITVFHFGPSLLKLLLPYLAEHYPDPQAFGHLRHVSSGGDMVPPEVLEQLKRVFPQAEVYVIYGSTEISCMGCTYAVPRDQTLAKTKVGQPHQNMTLQILDAHHNRVPIGSAGQLYFSGAGVVRGYFNQPQLTAEKFITIEGRRFYSIGDVGRFDAQGHVELLGRNDFQVQVRGMRVELPEIETHLKRFPGLRDCVVVSKILNLAPDPALVAYFTVDPAQADGGVTPAQLRQYLTDLLPDYMIPQRFVQLAALPTNLNGKLDRSALPDPDAVLAQTATAAVADPIDRPPPLSAARVALEQAIVAVWEQVLGQAPIDRHANFFELGGHSLLATQISLALQKHLQIAVPLAALFETPTVLGLAQHLEQQIGDSLTSHLLANGTAPLALPAAPFPPLPQAQPLSGEPLPLSATQEGLWFLQQLDPQSGVYNIPLLLHLQGPLDREALRHSLEALRERHSILRTRIFYDETAGYQQVLDDAPLSLDWVTLPYSDAVTAANWSVLLEQGSTNPRLQAVLTHLHREIHTPFAPDHDCLMRVTGIQLHADQHLLLITLHHAISDEWSLGILQTDLSTLYRCHCQGEPVSLSPFPLPFAAFAQWQQETLGTPAIQEQLDYWTEQLAGLPPLLELPTDFPRPAHLSTQGKMVSFQLEAELVQHLRQLSQREGVTLFMLLMTAFQVLLYRYSQQEDFAVGFPIAHRTQPELHQSIGCFIHTLVLRARLGPGLSFQELLAQVRQSTLAAYAHQDVPLEQVVKAMDLERNPGYTPLFQVFFAFQNTPALATDWGELAAESSILGTDTAKFDLSLYLFDQPQANQALNTTTLSGVWEYRTDLFEAETITRMMGHFQEILWSVVQDCQQPIHCLNLLSTLERDFLLQQGQGSSSIEAGDLWLHTFEEQVRQTPQAIALVYQNQQITYAQLNQQANQVARRLLDLGMAPETLVGLCLERSPDILVAMIAVWKAGGAYIPLDPVYPKARIDYVLQQAQVPILITQSRFVERVQQPNAQLLLLDTVDVSADLTTPLPNLPPLAQPDHLAYVLYTSGSTGKPKGVQITHRAVANFLASMAQTPGLGPDDRVLAITTISFDIAVLELFGPLGVGATVVLVSQAVASDGYQLTELVQQERITLLQATPATWRMLLAAGWQGASTLKMLCGGEPLSRELANRLLAKGGTLWNMYGPTETTVWSAVAAVEADPAPITLGQPIANTQLYVLDPQQQLLPLLVPGELYIGGAGLARGYLHRPDLTAERFIPNPLSNRSDDFLYRTGDRVRYRPDGSLEFLGRVDYQVKIRGFRIELGEIEAVLRQQPQLAEVVVIDREDRPGDKRLVAYVTLREGAEAPSLTDLRQFIQLQLPSYMLPSAFITLDTLPLTPNGKVDRRALPKPEQSILQGSETFVAPRTPLETQLADLWAQVLEQDHIGIHDNFFELGGHSILAIQLAKEMNLVLQARQLSVSLMQLFQHPTIDALCQILERSDDVLEPVSALVPLQSEGSQRPCFVINSTSQAKILSQLIGGEQPVYSLNMFCIRSLFDDLLAQAGAQPDKSAEPVSFIPAIAEQFVKDLKKIQPHGPYSLLGYCQDGPLTLELAQRLRAQGDEVAHLCLIDSPFQSHRPRFQHRLYSLSQIGLPYLFDSLQRFTKRYLAQNNQRNYREAIEDLSTQTRINRLGETPKDQLFYALYLAEGIRYAPRAYDRPITILLSSEWRFADLSILQNINPGQLITVPLRSPHTSLFREPYVRELAIALEQVLHANPLDP